MDHTGSVRNREVNVGKRTHGEGCKWHHERCEVDGCHDHDSRTPAQINADRAARRRAEDEADDRWWRFATTAE